MDKEVAGTVIQLSDDGYLAKFEQWTREIGAEIAKEEGIDLTADHWKVIDFIQESYRKSVPLSIRALGKNGPVSIKEFYALFPDGPLKKASRIAGIPKPASCI